MWATSTELKLTYYVILFFEVLFLDKFVKRYSRYTSFYLIYLVSLLTLATEKTIDAIMDPI